MPKWQCINIKKIFVDTIITNDLGKNQILEHLIEYCEFHLEFN